MRRREKRASVTFKHLLICHELNHAIDRYAEARGFTQTKSLKIFLNSWECANIFAGKAGLSLCEIVHSSYKRVLVLARILRIHGSSKIHRTYSLGHYM